jgi:hypothetical protein
LRHLVVIWYKNSVTLFFRSLNIVVFAKQLEILQSWRKHVLDLNEGASIGFIHLFKDTSNNSGDSPRRLLVDPLKDIFGSRSFFLAVTDHFFNLLGII